MQPQNPTQDPLLQQMQAFNKAFLDSCEVAARSFTDPKMAPRQRFELGCRALENLTQETLELESRWLAAVDQLGNKAETRDGMNLLPTVNHLYCSAMSDGIKARSQLWKTAFDQLHRAEALLPDTDATPDAGNPLEVWQTMTRSLLAAVAGNTPATSAVPDQHTEAQEAPAQDVPEAPDTTPSSGGRARKAR